MSLVTVVIPAKNEAPYLPSLLTSLCEQTVKPYEIIVADAGSTDKTRVIAKSFGARVVEGGLPGPGRNRGAAVATGDILVFMDADVKILERTFLEKALHEFSARGFDIATLDMCLPEGAFADKVQHELYNTYVRMWGGKHPHAPGCCMFVTKVLHDKIGGFDERVTFCEDHEYAGRASKHGVFGFLNSVKIGLTTRRQEKEGRAMLAVKYILAEAHLLFLGPIYHDKFHYNFDYVAKNKEKAKEKVR